MRAVVSSPELMLLMLLCSLPPHPPGRYACLLWPSVSNYDKQLKDMKARLNQVNAVVNSATHILRKSGAALLDRHG